MEWLGLTQTIDFERIVRTRTAECIALGLFHRI
jgi:hypothetical protein